MDKGAQAPLFFKQNQRVSGWGAFLPKLLILNANLGKNLRFLQRFSLHSPAESRINYVSEEITMKTVLQIAGIIAILGLLGALNAWHNDYKHSKCIEAGGRFLLNTSDSNQSTCIMDN